MFACFCLNILIETGTSDFEKVTSDSLNLSDEESKDRFFKQELGVVGKLINITKHQSSLVQMRNVGHWNINCCLNCRCEAYAVHKEKGAACVLIHSKLRDSKSLENVNQEEVSKVFNIIINPSDDESDTVLDLYNQCDGESIIKNIRQIMSEVITRESLAVEERIKLFAEEQYEILNNLKDSAYEEHDSLVRLVQGIVDQSKPTSTNTSSTQSIMKSSGRSNGQKLSSSSLSSAEKLTSIRHTPKRQKSSPAGMFMNSFDAEGLFDFEGSDGVNSMPDSDVEESDKEDMNDEGIIMHRQRTARASIAKSLPMNIPAFMSQANKHSTEDLDDFPQENTLDIAASIKALAKSVHGDAVFGELPRPRFSTQI